MTTLLRVTGLDELMRWRTEVLGHVFGADPDTGLLEANRDYYRTHIADGSHIAYIARQGEEEAGCGALCIYDEMPSPDNPTGRCGYLMNIYVREPYRKHGIASAIVKQLVADARSLACGKIYLETTDMGKGLYGTLGFKNMTGYMKHED